MSSAGDKTMTSQTIADLAVAETVARDASKAAYAVLAAAPKGPDGHDAYVAWVAADGACKRAIAAHRDAVEAVRIAAEKKAKRGTRTAEVDCNTGRVIITRNR